MKKRIGIILMCFAGFFTTAQAQQTADKAEIPRWNIKTNLLYDATTTFNLGVEFGLGAKVSLDVSGNWNPFTFSDNRKWKHIMAQPELRFWTGQQRFRGFFWGPHAHYAFYNVGNLPKPFSPYVRDHRFEGWAVGAGVSAGYRWNLSPRIGLEAVIGAGYAYLSYDKFLCQSCGAKISSETKHYFGPTKAAINLVINLGKTKKVAPQATVPVYVPPVVTQTRPETAPEPVQPVIVPEPAPTTGDKLAGRYTFIAPISDFDNAQAGTASGLSFDTGKPLTATQQSDLEQYIDGNREGSLTFYFRQGGRAIERGYRNNGASMDELLEAIRAIETSSDSRVARVVIAGFASPEGTAASNDRLAVERAATLKELIFEGSRIPSSAIVVHNGGEDWRGLRDMVAKSDMPRKAQVINIIDTVPAEIDYARNTSRKKQLMDLAGGEPWRYMFKNLFPELRNATYIKIYYENR